MGIGIYTVHLAAEIPIAQIIKIQHHRHYTHEEGMVLVSGISSVRSGSQLWISQLPHDQCCSRYQRLRTVPSVRCSASPVQHSRRNAMAAALAASTAAWSQPALASQLRDYLQSRQKIYVMAPIHITQQRLKVIHPWDKACAWTGACDSRHCP